MGRLSPRGVFNPMKQRIQGIVIGLIISSLIFSSGALALTGTRNIEVTFRDIKLYVAGALLTPRDANNNVIEPFLYNGTTYLPIRAVGQALGKDIEWDGVTNSIYIGGRDAGGPTGAPDAYLNDIQYTNFDKGWSTDNIYQINGTVIDHLDKIYDNGIILFTSGDGPTHQISGDADKANVSITYPLNGQYWTLKGNISLPKRIDIAGLSRMTPTNTSAVDVLFYGDGRLLHRAQNINSTYSHSFSIDVSNVNSLTIKVIGQTDSSNTNRYTALTDLGLYR